MISSYTNQDISFRPYIRNGPRGPIYGSLQQADARYEPRVDLVRDQSNDSGNEVLNIGLIITETKVSENDLIIFPGGEERVVLRSDPNHGLGGSIKFYEVFLK